jgi:hypothetical protein
MRSSSPNYGSSSLVDGAAPLLHDVSVMGDRTSQKKLSVNDTSSLHRSGVSTSSSLLRDESHVAVVAGSSPYGARRQTSTSTLVGFCQLYFKGKKVDITQNLPEPPQNLRSSSSNSAQQRDSDALLGETGDNSWYSRLASYPWCVGRIFELLRWLDALFNNTLKMSPRDRATHLMFDTLLLMSFAANMVSLFVSVYSSDSQSCNIIIPTASDDCCQCVCDINASWCATIPRSYLNTSLANGTRVLVQLEEYGNYFSGTNSIERTVTSKRLYVAVVYALSLGFTIVQMGMARIRGNWYMLLCICSAMLLQGLRNVYLHFPVNTWNDFAATADGLDVTVLVADGFSIITAIVAAGMLQSLRPAFLTTQFQQFGYLTTHQETLRNYNVMFAAVLFDWQTSSLLYLQLAALSAENPQFSVCITIMMCCDMTSNYLGYTYIRFERYWGAVIALLSKAILTVSWIIFGMYVMQCFDLFRSRALYLRVTLIASQYLGVDAADAQAYLLGDCKISPIVSGSGDVVVMILIMAIAFFVRVISIFYAALLTANFGDTIIASLFFDVVAIQQKSGLPLPDAAVDTLDVVKRRT